MPTYHPNLDKQAGNY